MRESKFSWIFCGLQRYVGRRLSVQVFVFSTVLTSVGSSRIRAAIFIRRLGWLNAQRRVYNFKRD